MKKIEFIDWVKKNGKPVKISNKKTKVIHTLERWIVEIDDKRYEKILKVECLPDDFNFVFNERGQLKYNLVPNALTDSKEEVEMYEEIGRTIYGRGEVRIIPNIELRNQKKRDLELKTKMLKLINDPKYVLYRTFLRLKYAQFVSPSIRNLKRWKQVPKHIKNSVNELLYE